MDDQQFFRNWLSRIDVRMRLRRRKILLFLDRCPAHPPDVRLTNIEIVFLPANTTSILQPLDAGIIRCFKAHYRRLLMDKLLKRLELNLEESTSEAAKTVTVLDAIQLIQTAWSLVSESSISNCFKKCGFKALDSDSDSRDPPTEEPTQEDEVLVMVARVGAEFVSFDDGVPCVDDEVGEAAADGDEEDGPEDEVISFTEAIRHLDSVKVFFEANGLDPSPIKEAQDIVMNNMLKKQTKITDFFGRTK